MEPPIRSLVICKADPAGAGGSALRNSANILALQRLGPVAVVSLSKAAAQVPGRGDTEAEPYEIERPTLALPPFWLRWWWLLLADPAAAAGPLQSRTALETGRSLARRFRPDLVIAEETPAMKVAAAAATGARVIYDAHNAETTLRREIARSEPRWIDRIKSRQRAKAWERLEREACRRADAVWCVSDIDARGLQRLEPAATIHVVPNSIDLSYYERPVVDPQATAHILTGSVNILLTGSFDYLPNEQAASILIEAVLPRIETLAPGARVVLAGRNPTQRLRSLAARHLGVTITGEVPDMRPYLRWADVMVAPIQVGGGSRVKFLEAFASRCPVVTTTRGAEGLAVCNERHLLISDRNDEMALSAIAVARDPAKRMALTDAAHAFVKEHFSTEATADRIRVAVADLPRPRTEAGRGP